MASLVYNKAIHAEAVGAIDFDTDTFKVMLLTSAYAADRDAHNFRSDLTDEAAGAGYTAGGNTVAATVTRDDANNRTDISFAATNWPTATITARYAAYYKSRGGAAGADELIGLDDFGADVVSTGGTFTLAATILRKQG